MRVVVASPVVGQPEFTGGAVVVGREVVVRPTGELIGIVQHAGVEEEAVLAEETGKNAPIVQVGDTIHVGRQVRQRVRRRARVVSYG